MNKAVRCVQDLKAAQIALESALEGVSLPQTAKDALGRLKQAQGAVGERLLALWERDARASIRDAKSALR